jgi:hypothetical protein
MQDLLTSIHRDSTLIGDRRTKGKKQYEYDFQSVTRFQVDCSVMAYIVGAANVV